MDSDRCDPTYPKTTSSQRPPGPNLRFQRGSIPKSAEREEDPNSFVSLMSLSSPHSPRIRESPSPMQSFPRFPAFDTKPYSSGHISLTDKGRPGHVSPLPFILSTSCGRDYPKSARQAPSSARFPSKPPPVPAGGIKDAAPPPVLTLRQKSGNSNTKHKKRELGEFGKEKGKTKKSAPKEQPKKETKKQQVKEQSSEQDKENKEKPKKQSEGEEEENIEDSKERSYRSQSEPTIRLRNYVVLKKEALSLSIPLNIWGDADCDSFGEEEVAFFSQKNKVLFQRMIVLEQLDESREKELTERENDVVAFTEIFEEIEESDVSVIEVEMDEEKGGPIQELESILSTFDFQGGASQQVITPEEETAEKREKSAALKREIEDEFLLIDSLVQIYEDSNGGDAEDDNLVLLKKFSEEVGEKKTEGEGEGEGEKEVSKDGVCSEEGKGAVEAIQGQMERLRKMLTSEQASLSQMERTIKVESTRLSDLAKKKQQRIGYLEKLKVLKKKENEIREKVEKESKKLNEKSRLLLKQKDDLLTRLSTMRRLITEKNKEITKLKLSKQSQQTKNEEFKKKRQRENWNEKERREGGKVEGVLYVQIAELCRARNAWYQGVREDLLSEICHYKPKSRQRTSSEENSRTPPLEVKISSPPFKASSPRLKAPTGKREVGTRSIKAFPLSPFPSLSSPSSSLKRLPAPPTRAPPPVPHSQKRSSPTISPRPSTDFALHNTSDGEMKEFRGRRNWSQSVNLSHKNSFKEGLVADSGNQRERGNFLGITRVGADCEMERKGRKEKKVLNLSKKLPSRTAPELPQSPRTPREKEKGTKKKPRKRMSSRAMTLSATFSLTNSPSKSPQGSPSSSPADSPRSPKEKMLRNSSMSNMMKRKFSIGPLYKNK